LYLIIQLPNKGVVKIFLRYCISCSEWYWIHGICRRGGEECEGGGQWRREGGEGVEV